MAVLPEIFSKNNSGLIEIHQAFNRDRYGQIPKERYVFSWSGACFVCCVQIDESYFQVMAIKSKNATEEEFSLKTGYSYTYTGNELPPVVNPTSEAPSTIPTQDWDGGYIEGFSDLYNELSQDTEFIVKIATFTSQAQGGDRSTVPASPDDSGWKTEYIISEDGNCVQSLGFSENFLIGSGFKHVVCPNETLTLWRYINGEMVKREYVGYKQSVQYAFAEILAGYSSEYEKFNLPDLSKRKMDWEVFLDGDKPIININGSSPSFGYEEGQTDPLDSHVSIYVAKFWGEIAPEYPSLRDTGDIEWYEIGSLPLLSLPFETTYEDCFKTVDGLAWATDWKELLWSPSAFFEWIGDKLNGGKIRVAMRLQANEEIGRWFTDWVYLDIPAKLPESPEEINTGRYEQKDGSTIKVIFGYPDSEDDFYPDGDGEGKDPNDPDDIIDEGGGYTSHSLLTTTYAMLPARIQQLGRVLWSDNFMDNIQLVNNSPIENIVSVKVFPFDISGTDEEIKLGNVDTGVNGKKVANDYSYRHSIGSMVVKRKYNSFLDYAPFTQLQIFLPFIGYKDLDTNVFMGKTLKVDYICDLVTGACKAILFSDGVPMIDFDGSVGIDIPIAASNRAQVESGYITSAMGAVASLATGNVGGAIGSALSGAISPYHTQTQGSASPSCSAYQSRDIFLIYNRPVYTDLSAFNHTKGRKCNLSKLLNNLSGFTSIDNNTDLSGIPCTDIEREMLRDMLTKGVYL